MLLKNTPMIHKKQYIKKKMSFLGSRNGYSYLNVKLGKVISDFNLT